jgi:hypothetical protein
VALLTRAEILGAAKIARLLDQAQADTPEAGLFKAKALQLTRKHPRGRHIYYDGQPVLPREPQ